MIQPALRLVYKGNIFLEHFQ